MSATYIAFCKLFILFVLQVATEDDLVIGRLLRLSVLQDPRLAKAWKRLGDWAYEIGQKVVEDATKNNHKVGICKRIYYCSFTFFRKDSSL